jgi:hypothetical protein
MPVSVEVEVVSSFSDIDIGFDLVRCGTLMFKYEYEYVKNGGRPLRSAQTTWLVGSYLST